METIAAHGNTKAEVTGREGDWIQVYSGGRFWPLDPRPEEIHIEDIAHALSMQCRFGGHCEEFYSVAQHCVEVSFRVPLEDAAWGLLHDAAEAYLVDLPRPVKYWSIIGRAYREAERRLMTAICERFGLPSREPDSVRMADEIMLMTEKRDLMKQGPSWDHLAVGVEPAASIIIGDPPAKAEEEFLRRAKVLGIP